MTDAMMVLGVVAFLGAAPVVAAATKSPHLGAKRAATVLAGGFVAAAGAFVAALGDSYWVVPGFRLDAFSALILVLVTGMGATVIAFSSRSLRHEPYQRRFCIRAATLLGAIACSALTTNLVVGAGAWVATSVLTWSLIRVAVSPARPASTRRTVQALAVGDAAFIAAMVMLATSSGSMDIGEVPNAREWVSVAAGILIVIAACARGAVGPFARWLPESLAAPTPVSAILHAGVVNGGAIAMVKFAPAVSAHVVPAIAALLIATLSCMVAEAVMLTRPDIKGSLAWSTVAQMSFTTALCALGLTTAAVAHLVAHGCYKGMLFLGSGSTVRGLVQRRSAPPAPVRVREERMRDAMIAASSSAAAIVAAAWLSGEFDRTTVVPLLLAWITATCATTAMLQRTALRRHRIGLVGAVSGAAAAFVVVGHAVHEGLAAATNVDHALSVWWALIVVFGLAAVEVARRRTTHPVARQLWSVARVMGRTTRTHRRQPVITTFNAASVTMNGGH